VIKPVGCRLVYVFRFRRVDMFGRILAIAVLSACVALPAAAQKPGRQQQKQQLKAEKKGQGQDVRKFQKKLNLSDEQAGQVKALLDARNRERAGGKQGKRNTQEEFRTKLRAILTPEQATILDQRAAGKKR
jgi:Spy/CpxP family protein refolding chaperone